MQPDFTSSGINIDNIPETIDLLKFKVFALLLLTYSIYAYRRKLTPPAKPGKIGERKST